MLTSKEFMELRGNIRFTWLQQLSAFALQMFQKKITSHVALQTDSP